MQGFVYDFHACRDFDLFRNPNSKEACSGLLSQNSVINKKPKQMTR